LGVAAAGERLVHRLLGVAAHEAELARGDLPVGMEQRRQPHRPESDRVERLGLVPHRRGDLRRAAADVDAQRARPLGLAAEDASLPAAGHALEIQPGLDAGAADDLVPVLRLAHRARRHRPDDRVVAAAQRAVAPQRRQQAVGDVARDRPRPEHPFPGADRVALRMDELQRAVRQRARHLQADRARPDIDGGEHWRAGERFFCHSALSYCPKSARATNVTRPPQTKHKPVSHCARMPLTDPKLYINREWSWLAFNDRVLQEAKDASLPLYERLKFLAIVSSNLDEFFMVRVAGLKQQLLSNVAETSADRLLPADQLAGISERAHAMVAEQYRIWREEIVPAMHANAVCVQAVASLTAEHKNAMRLYFQAHVFPALTPLAVDPGHPFPHLRNKSLNVAVLL